jgi:hypothetical protein
MQRGKSDHYIEDEKFKMFASSMGEGAAVHAGPQEVLMEGGARAGERQGRFSAQSSPQRKSMSPQRLTFSEREMLTERSFPIFSSSHPRLAIRKSVTPLRVGGRELCGGGRELCVGGDNSGVVGLGFKRSTVASRMRNAFNDEQTFRHRCQSPLSPSLYTHSLTRTHSCC